MKWTALLSVFLFAVSANATTYYLQSDGSGDFPDIQTAIDSAAVGDTLSLADGTYAGDGNRNIDYLGKPLVVRSESGNPEACIIDVQYEGRGFLFLSGEDSTSVLEGVGITNGYVIADGFGGGIRCEASAPSISNCKFTNCVAGEGGGALYVNGGEMTLQDCVSAGNVSFSDGGACFVTNSAQFAFQGCQFMENIGEYGGAISSTSSGVLTLQGCTFTDNEGTNNGGAIRSNSELDLEGCQFTGNSGDGGGAISCVTHVTLTNCDLISNHADDQGGAVQSGSTEVDSCTFIDNTGVSGGALRCVGAVTVSDSWFLGNSCTSEGGDMWISGNLDISRCTFAGGSAGAGAAVRSLDNHGGLIVSCTFYGSSSGNGCLYFSGSEPIIRNTVIAFGVGGGAIGGSGSPTLTCCNIYGNEGGDWNGMISEQFGLAGNISLDPWFCTPEEGDFTLHEDSPCVAYSEPNPECDQIGAWPVGCIPMAIPGNKTTSGNASVRLDLLSENPNTGDRIVLQSVTGSAGLAGDLAIYDASGRMVKVLHSGQLREGIQVHSWDAVDSHGRRASPGVYFARLGNGTEAVTRCLIVIR